MLVFMPRNLILDQGWEGNKKQPTANSRWQRQGQRQGRKAEGRKDLDAGYWMLDTGAVKKPDNRRAAAVTGFCPHCGGRLTGEPDGRGRHRFALRRRRGLWLVV